jgi:uncharacterized protein YfkK (UPF0435 family)
MNDDLQLQQITNIVLDIFYSSTNRENIDLKIEYLDDIYKRRLELANNEREKNDVITSRDFITTLNGTMVLPKTKDEIYYILISKSVLKDYQFISTIIHELTHIYDFRDFVTEFCNNCFDKAESHDLYIPFYCWTEYNARKNGYKYYRAIIYKINSINLSEDEQIEHILNTELKLHYESLLRNLREYSDDRNATKYIYNIIQFLGRFSVWEELFPKKINANRYLPDFLINTYGSRILDIYSILVSAVDFNVAKGKLLFLHNAINELFK